MQRNCLETSFRLATATKAHERTATPGVGEPIFYAKVLQPSPALCDNQGISSVPAESITTIAPQVWCVLSASVMASKTSCDSTLSPSVMSSGTRAVRILGGKNTLIRQSLKSIFRSNVKNNRHCNVLPKLVSYRSWFCKSGSAWKKPESALAVFIAVAFKVTRKYCQVGNI